MNQSGSAPIPDAIKYQLLFLYLPVSGGAPSGVTLEPLVWPHYPNWSPRACAPTTPSNKRGWSRIESRQTRLRHSGKRMNSDSFQGGPMGGAKLSPVFITVVFRTAPQRISRSPGWNFDRWTVNGSAKTDSNFIAVPMWERRLKNCWMLLSFAVYKMLIVLDLYGPNSFLGPV